MNLYENYKNQVDAELARFKKESQKIRTSENPYYRDKAIQDYDIKQLRDEMEKNVGEIKAKYEAELAEKIEQQEVKAARSHFSASESDKRLVDEYVSNLITDARLAYTDNEKLEAYGQFERKLDFLDENGLHEVKKRLPEVLEKVGDSAAIEKELKGLNQTFKGLQTKEQIELEELRKLKDSDIDFGLNIYKKVSAEYSDHPDNTSDDSFLKTIPLSD